jgi:hypothetical protein
MTSFQNRVVLMALWSGVTVISQDCVIGAKTSNRHVFPIDINCIWARMAIAGARTTSSPSPAGGREPED